MKNPLNKYAMPKNWLKPTNFDLICGTLPVAHMLLAFSPFLKAGLVT